MTGTRRQRRNAILVAGAATLLVCGSAVAGPITPLDQVRSVDGYVLVCQCQGEHMDSEAAKGFDPFDGTAEARLDCDLAMAVGSASQQSQITEDALIAAGRADSEAGAGVVDTIHAFGHSRYTVTFEIDADVEFSLTGEISAGAFGDPEVLAGASVWLTGPGEGRIIDLRILPGPGGERRSQKVAQCGALAPGVYTFQATADTLIDNKVPPARAAEAAFDLAFAVFLPCPADLDDSGAVDFGDILAVLSAWGNKGGPEDLDESGFVDFGDLLIVLSAWGPCPE